MILQKSLILSIASLAIFSFSQLTTAELTCRNRDDPCPDDIPSVDCFDDVCEEGSSAFNDCDDQGLVCYPNYCGGCNYVCCLGTVLFCDPNETFTCPDGTIVKKDEDTGCTAYFKCGNCAAERLLCPNGYTEVDRNPANDCEFDQCPEPFVPTCETREDACLPGVPDFSNDCLYEPCDDKICGQGQTCYNSYCGGCHGVCCDNEL